MEITVAVCTYRRFDLLRACLKSLEKQSIDQSKYKILVIDNSLQPRASASFRESLHGFKNLEYVITKQCGIAFARNEALKRCETEFLAFTDDDCITPSDWLETILSEFSALDESVAVIGGRILPMWETEQPEWLEKRLFHQLALIDWGEERMPIYHSEGKWLLTANAAYRTDTLHKVGGFPMHLGRRRKLPLAQEEFAVNQKLLGLGFLMVYVPNLSVKHFISQERATKRAMLRDAFWDGVSQVLLTTHNLEANDTDKLSEKLMPLQDQLLSEMDESISGDILFEKANEFRGKGFNGARHTLIDKVQVESYADSVWPVVYIVTPSFNAINTIDQTIMSVVTQAGDFSIRYHVQDGGSKDGTVKKLGEWKKRLTDWTNPLLQCRNIVFSYKSELDHSMYDAISKGFKYMDIPAKAAMTWINSDDYLMPGALATVQKAFSLSEDVSWIIGAVHSCTEKSYPFACHRFGFPLALIRTGLCDGHHWQHVQQEGTFWRKCLWDKVGGLDLLCKYAGDWDLWRRFAKYCTPVQTDWPLGCFRSRPNQLSANHMDLYNAEVESRASFAQRQKALNRLIEKDDIRTHVLVGTSDKNYEIKETYLSSENIPGCTWQNCHDFAATLLNHPVPADMNEGNKTKRDLLPRIKAVQTTLSQDVTFIKSSWEKTHWQLSPVPDQPNVFFTTGWHFQESDTTGWWRWCAGQGIFHIKTFKLQKASLFLTLASAFKENEILIHINGKEVFRHTVGLESREFGPVALQLKAGINIVLIHSKQTPANSQDNFDSRNFVVKNVRIERSKPGFLDVRNRLVLTRMASWIKKSRLFLTTYYLHQIPELKENNQCPEAHYLLYGAWENKDPNPLFDSAWYFSQYRDVYLSGLNPLFHYMQHGWKEGRDPHPKFSTERYLSDYEDVRESGMNPLLHYLLHGILEGRKIHPGT